MKKQVVLIPNLLRRTASMLSILGLNSRIFPMLSLVCFKYFDDVYALFYSGASLYFVIPIVDMKFDEIPDV